MKTSQNIKLQSTAISRRKYKHQGRMVGGYGRKVKDSLLTSQMVCTESSDNVYFALPSQKNRSNKQVHSLQESVRHNRPNPKKH